MKKLTDEEIQKLLEQSLNIPDELDGDDDTKAYQLLFDGLREEPEAGLPYNFSKKVVAQVQHARNHRQDVKLYVFMAIGIVFGVAIVAAFIAVFNYKAGVQLVTILDTYKWVVIFMIAGVLGIQYLDQGLLKKRKGLV
jgi:hypothetical protein